MKSSRRYDERGTSLVLVLIFLVVAGLITGGLLDASTNDALNTENFASSRNFNADAMSVTNEAIQSIRYAPELTTTENASPPSYCWGSGPTSQVTNADGNQIAVWCSTVFNPTSTATRVVTFSACRSALTASSSTATITAAATACALNPWVQAVVTFDDYPLGLSPPNNSQCVTYCGTGMTINSWVQNPTGATPGASAALPTVTSISPAIEPTIGTTNGNGTLGGTQVTITGTGFVSGSKVNFVEESGNSPMNYNVVIPATSVQVLSAVSIAAVAPPITAGTTYFVTVTTPSGTSAYNTTSGVFTYTLRTPTVTSLSVTGGTACDAIPGDPSGVTACGSTAGGTAVTITGTGFASNDSVYFVEESNGVAVAPAVSIQVGCSPSNCLVVNSSTSITAVSPAITVGSTYFVTVFTPNVGTSAVTSPSDVFWYFPLVPTVSSVSPTSQGTVTGGTTVTITGTGFFTGASVQFVQESNDQTIGNPIAGTNPVVVSATSMTVLSPSVKTATTYFVTVTTPAGGTSGTPSPIYKY